MDDSVNLFALGNSERQFRFQQFCIADDRATMRVGTDGILLGAWAEIESARRILDIGTGSGLLALMAAQRNAQAFIDAVEVDEPSAQQTAENFHNSPWADRLRVWTEDFLAFAQRFELEMTFDALICNPPFFRAGPRSPHLARSRARHQVQLSPQDLLNACRRLATANGALYLIVPAGDEGVWVANAEEVDFRPQRITRVRPLPKSPFKRVLIRFSTTRQVCKEDELTIELAKHQYSPEYRALTREFYLP